MSNELESLHTFWAYYMLLQRSQGDLGKEDRYDKNPGGAARRKSALPVL